MNAAARAEAYDRHTGRYGRELAAAFVRFAGVEPGMRVLDVDPSQAYAQARQERVPGAAIRVGSAEALTFNDGGFDAVLAQLVIQALDDAPAAAREMRRVAAPGGVVAACVWDFRDGVQRLWQGADIADFDDAWFSFAAGAGHSGAYCHALDDGRRAALREEFRRRLAAREGPFRLEARAWAVRGHG